MFAIVAVVAVITFVAVFAFVAVVAIVAFVAGAAFIAFVADNAVAAIFAFVAAYTIPTACICFVHLFPIAMFGCKFFTNSVYCFIWSVLKLFITFKYLCYHCFNPYLLFN